MRGTLVSRFLGIRCFQWCSGCVGLLHFGRSSFMYFAQICVSAHPVGLADTHDCIVPSVAPLFDTPAKHGSYL